MKIFSRDATRDCISGNRQMGPLKLTNGAETLVMSVSAWRNASLLLHCPWNQAADGTLSICAKEPPEPEQPEPKKRSRAPTGRASVSYGMYAYRGQQEDETCLPKGMKSACTVLLAT